MVEVLFRFTGRYVAVDPTGYYYERWDRAQPVSVIARTKTEASQKLWAMLGKCPRTGFQWSGSVAVS